jgi:hypothetical protein
MAEPRFCLDVAGKNIQDCNMLLSGNLTHGKSMKISIFKNNQIIVWAMFHSCVKFP